MRMQLLSVAGILVLSFLAEKCRQLRGVEHPSRSRTERFTFTNCFDMGFGTTACILKEIIKLYLYYIRALYVHKVRAEAAEKALAENLSKRQDFDRSVAVAREQGKAAARRASRQAKHVMGPMVSAGWDLFEIMYVGGSAEEAIARSCGTFVGAYSGGIAGEGKMGWLGFVVGSQVGSWIGGRIGLMGYDIWACLQYMLHRISGNLH
ncbi:hypothetical protein Salat_0518200 [Sesamum alatum]|uniref:Uncharacterized protein n=1 Tax=Sesamum alatum TaxID=300844 RepID=A0AAE1Z5G1_9LAMI|nr:hypothetical protein Salat_0518200 [Sesamum alatum]